MFKLIILFKFYLPYSEGQYSVLISKTVCPTFFHTPPFFRSEPPPEPGPTAKHKEPEPPKLGGSAVGYNTIGCITPATLQQAAPQQAGCITTDCVAICDGVPCCCASCCGAACRGVACCCAACCGVARCC